MTFGKAKLDIGLYHDEMLVQQARPLDAGMKMTALSNSLLQRWPGAFFQQRADFTFESVSPRMETLTGVSASQLEKTPELFWQVVHELDVERVKKEVERVPDAWRSAAIAICAGACGRDGREIWRYRWVQDILLSI